MAEGFSYPAIAVDTHINVSLKDLVAKMDDAVLTIERNMKTILKIDGLKHHK